MLGYLNIFFTQKNCLIERFFSLNLVKYFGFLNFQKWRVVTQANAKSKSEKFPPPHQDGAVGHPLDSSHKGPVSFGTTDSSFSSALFNSKVSSESVGNHDATRPHSHKGRKTNKADSQTASSWKFMRAFKPTSIGPSMNLFFRSK